MSAANFIPNYIKFIDNIQKKEEDVEAKVKEAITFNQYMDEMRKKVSDDLKNQDEYFPRNLD